ncbi:peptidase E [Candidatus Pacearchaeota archaeon]|nr:peptidase E [Candidatus Pacearchaeota archaeon]
MKIVAIGGGEIGRPGTKIETESIDKEVIRLSGKTHPKLLFIPTASEDSESYYQVVQNYYGKRLGCITDVLYLIKNNQSRDEIRNKVLNSNIIYVGGGNTLRMLKVWRKCGLDDILKEAHERGIVLAGISAGAICWFKYANSDSLKFSDSRNPLIKLKGLDFIPLMSCPHYDSEKIRRPSLRRMIKENGGISIALENCSAIEIVDGQYKIITSSKMANVFKVYRKNDKVMEDKLPKDGKYRPLDELLKS